MTQCSNCYNGCPEIVSDKCVKYTGIDVPVLGIQNGDSLSYVEQAIIGFLTSTLDGSGIKIDLPEDALCAAVSANLPTCGDITLVDILTALSKTICSIFSTVTDNTTDITEIFSILDTLNGDYDIECLEGVTSTSDTHAIVQSIINKLCAFIIEVDSVYVKNADLCNLVEACISANSPVNKAYAKMIPYTIVEYYGSLSNYPSTGDSFDTSGAGQNYWEKIYICNGSNGTPDKRGRVQVGAINGIPGTTLPAAVNPLSSPFNPDYQKGVPYNGTNSATLLTANIPAHAHQATSVVTETPHTHRFSDDNSNPTDPARTNAGIALNTLFPGGPISAAGTGGGGLIYNTSAASTGLTVATTIASTGDGNPFSIVQPAIGCTYIMYIP